MHKPDGPHDQAMATILATATLVHWTTPAVLLAMIEAHRNSSVLYGLLVTEDSWGSITVDMLGYKEYF